MYEIIAIINQKGGVGKTSTAYNLAYVLSIFHQRRTLLIDLDPNRYATKALLHKLAEFSSKDVLVKKDFLAKNAIYPAFINDSFIKNLWIMPANIGLATAEYEMRRIRRESVLREKIEESYKEGSTFDYIIIDCPSTLSALTINAIDTAHTIIIPITYEEDALSGMQDLLDNILEVKGEEYIQYLLLRNAFDARTLTMNKYLEEKIFNFTSKGYVMETIIRQDEDITIAKSKNLPLNLYNSKSRAAHDYLALAKEITCDE